MLPLGSRLSRDARDGGHTMAEKDGRWARAAAGAAHAGMVDRPAGSAHARALAGAASATAPASPSLVMLMAGAEASAAFTEGAAPLADPMPPSGEGAGARGDALGASGEGAGARGNAIGASGEAGAQRSWGGADGGGVASTTVAPRSPPKRSKSRPVNPFCISRNEEAALLMGEWGERVWGERVWCEPSWEGQLASFSSASFDRRTPGDDRRQTGDDRRAPGDDRRQTGDDRRAPGDAPAEDWSEKRPSSTTILRSPSVAARRRSVSCLPAACKLSFEERLHSARGLLAASARVLLAE